MVTTMFVVTFLLEILLSICITRFESEMGLLRLSRLLCCGGALIHSIRKAAQYGYHGIVAAMILLPDFFLLLTRMVSYRWRWR